MADETATKTDSLESKALTIRKGLSNHVLITTTMKRDDGKIIHIRKSTRPEMLYTAQINSTCSAQLNATLDSQQRELMGEMPNHHSGYLTRAGHSAC